MEGDFTAAGGNPANSIARWDGSNWWALGSGMSRSGSFAFVDALAFSGSDLYAAGGFTTAGGVPASAIAKWDGTNWSALGSGVGGQSFGDVLALVAQGPRLYTAGLFDSAGGKVSAYVARTYLLPLPTLYIRRSGSNVVTASWPSPQTAGFALEWARALGSSVSWVSNTVSVADDGINKSVTLPLLRPASPTLSALAASTSPTRVG